MRRTPKRLRASIKLYAEARSIDLDGVLNTALKMPYVSLSRIAAEGGGGPTGWVIMQYLVRERLYWEMKRDRG